MVLRSDERLARIAWPELTDASMELVPGDALVTCAGFEGRALAFLSSAIEIGARGFRVVGIEYRPVVDENQFHSFSAMVLRARASMQAVIYDREDPGDSSEILRDVMDASRILIDVSGMSRLLIVQLVSESIRMGLAGKTQVIYTEAEEYPPTEEEVDRRLAEAPDYLGMIHFISSDVLGIQTVPELSTVAMQGQPIRLVVFPSFNPTQLAAVCSETQASLLSIIHGVPPRKVNAWRKEAIRTLNRVEAVREKEEYDSSTLDYRETVKILLDLYHKGGASEKLVIAPTGSKMQSVAVGIVCGFLRDIQIVYPTPRSFPSPSNYTRGMRHTYALPLAEFASEE